MTASPGIPRARIVPSGRTRDGVATPLPHPLRRGAAVDHALWARVTRYARTIAPMITTPPIVGVPIFSR